MMPPPKIAVMTILKKQLTKLSYENIRDKCINDKSSCPPKSGVHNINFKVRPPASNGTPWNTARTK